MSEQALILRELEKRAKRGELSDGDKAIVTELTSRARTETKADVDRELTSMLPGFEVLDALRAATGSAPREPGPFSEAAARQAGAEMMPGFEFTQLLPPEMRPQAASVTTRAALGGGGNELAATNIGEAAGQMMGAAAGGAALAPLGAAPLGVGVGRVAGGALGSGLGMLVNAAVSGRDVTARDVALESGLSLLPETAESAIRGLGRRVMRNTPGGKILREVSAFERARGMGRRLFTPPSREFVDKLFQLVRRSGAKLPTANISTFTSDLSTVQFNDLTRNLRRMEGGPFGSRFGEQIVTGLKDLRKGDINITAFDIGRLQHLRSQTRKLAGKRTGSISDLLSEFKDELDKSVDLALARPDAIGETASLLKRARHQWRMFRSAEELDDLIVKHSRAVRGKRGVRAFNLQSMEDDLAKEGSQLAKQVNTALTGLPDAQRQLFEKELNAIAPLFRTIEIGRPIGMGGRILTTNFSNILLSPIGRSLLMKTATEGRGVISPNAFSIIINTVRREQQQGLDPGVTQIIPQQTPLVPQSFKQRQTTDKQIRMQLKEDELQRLKQ